MFVGPVVTTQHELDVAAPLGEIWRAEFGATIAIATTGVFYVGVTTGETPMHVLSRAYSSSESPLSVELFEASFSGGSNARTLNRNLAITSTPPFQFVANVTPGALGAVVTGVTLRAPTSGGSAAVSIPADTNSLILKRNTSYVVRFTNGGPANAVVSGAIDYTVLD